MNSSGFNDWGWGWGMGGLVPHSISRNLEAAPLHSHTI